MVLAASLLSACSPGNLINWGDGWNALTARDGILYVGTRQGEVLALDGITGDSPSIKWRFAPQKPDEGERDLRVGSVFGMPAVGEQYVYVGDRSEGNKRDGRNGRLYALRKDRGSNSNTLESGEWFRDVQGGIVGGPALAEKQGLVLVGSDDGKLYAFHTTGDTAEKITPGDRAWIFETDGQVWSPPVVGNGIVYFGSMDGHVYALSLEEGLNRAGRLLWKYKTGGAVVSKPLLLDGMVIVGSFDKTLYALDARAGTSLWSFKGDDWFWAGPTSDGELIFAPTMEGTIYALDKNGNPGWFEPFLADSPIVSTPVVVDDRLGVASDRGRLYLLRTRSGEQDEQSIPPGKRIKGSLSSNGSVVFVGVTDNTVRAYSVAERWTQKWRFSTKE